MRWKIGPAGAHVVLALYYFCLLVYCCKKRLRIAVHCCTAVSNKRQAVLLLLYSSSNIWNNDVRSQSRPAGWTLPNGGGQTDIYGICVPLIAPKLPCECLSLILFMLVCEGGSWAMGVFMICMIYQMQRGARGRRRRLAGFLIHIQQPTRSFAPNFYIFLFFSPV